MITSSRKAEAKEIAADQLTCQLAMRVLHEEALDAAADGDWITAHDNCVAIDELSIICNAEYNARLAAYLKNPRSTT